MKDSTVRFFVLVMMGTVAWLCLLTPGPTTSHIRRPQSLPIETFLLNHSDPRPLLSRLIADYEQNITGNVSHLLDFAILGHPKTGTTFTIKWLAAHPEMDLSTEEDTSLNDGRPAQLVQRLYQRDPTRKHGYKYPRDLQSKQSLEAIATHWPHAKLMVGLRHPIRWFESFYNFRLRTSTKPMPPPELLNGTCIPGSDGVCVHQAWFHYHLSLLGKTALSSSRELSLLPRLPQPVAVPNPVFLFHLEQLQDERHQAQYTRDLQDFLGLSSPLDPLPSQHESKNHKYGLDLCEERYRPLRASLLAVGRDAATWIEEYLLEHVQVSNEAQFVALLRAWREDPCEAEGA